MTRSLSQICQIYFSIFNTFLFISPVIPDILYDSMEAEAKE